MDAAARPIRTEAERNPMIEAGSGFWWMMAAIALYFLAMVGIGLWASTRTNDKDDYMIGGRDLPAPVAALSAGASDMSGWLLMGLPGALFVAGMSELWIVIGLFIGTWANWKWIAPRLRVRVARSTPLSIDASVRVTRRAEPAASASSSLSGTAARMRAWREAGARSMEATASHSWPSRGEPSGSSPPGAFRRRPTDGPDC